MDLKVGFHSSKDVVFVKRTDSLAHAYNVMTKISARHLPVIDEDETVIGMLSDRDVLRAMIKPVGSEWFAVPANPEFDSRQIVQEFMSWPICTIDQSATLIDAAKLMLERKISSLVVTKDLQVIGIVTTENLLQAFIADHKPSPGDVKSQLLSAIYRSPVGSIIQSLSNAGI